MVRVLILKSGAPHQSQAPSSEFKGGIRVLILKSGAPHQSQAPSSEFKGGKSSDFKIRGAPSDRRIGVFASWIGVSAYLLLDRRIGVFSGRIGVSAYFSPGPAYRRAAYRRMRVLA